MTHSVALKVVGLIFYDLMKYATVAAMLAGIVYGVLWLFRVV